MSTAAAPQTGTGSCHFEGHATLVHSVQVSQEWSTHRPWCQDWICRISSGLAETPAHLCLGVLEPDIGSHPLECWCPPWSWWGSETYLSLPVCSSPSFLWGYSPVWCPGERCPGCVAHRGQARYRGLPLWDKLRKCDHCCCTQVEPHHWAPLVVTARLIGLAFLRPARISWNKSWPLTWPSSEISRTAPSLYGFDHPQSSYWSTGRYEGTQPLHSELTESASLASRKPSPMGF